MPILSGRLLKRAILLFWALYFTLILASNLTDGLKAMGMLPEWFRFVSGNYRLIAKVTSIYNTPPEIVAVLFVGVLLWEALAALLFWRAFVRFEPQDALSAFVVGLALWATFIIMDELFIAFEVANLEGSHLNLLSAQFITLLALHLLPDEVAREAPVRRGSPL